VELTKNNVDRLNEGMLLYIAPIQILHPYTEPVIQKRVCDHCGRMTSDMKSQDAARPLRASGDFDSVQHGNKPDTCEPNKRAGYDVFTRPQLPDDPQPIWFKPKDIQRHFMDKALDFMESQDAAPSFRANDHSEKVQHGNKPDTCEPVKDEVEEFFKNNPIRGQTQSFYVELSNAIEARIMRKLGKV
jgi:hypothetical protein